MMLTNDFNDRFELPPHDENRLIGIPELAARLGRSPKTVACDNSRAQEKLPPRFNNPGYPKGKGPVRWLLRDVNKWLHTAQSDFQKMELISSVESKYCNKRGAPTNTEKKAAQALNMGVSEYRKAKLKGVL